MAPRRAFRILGIDKTADTSPATCPLAAETLASQSSKAKGLFYALIVNSILKCSIDAGAFEVTFHLTHNKFMPMFQFICI